VLPAAPGECCFIPTPVATLLLPICRLLFIAALMPAITLMRVMRLLGY